MNDWRDLASSVKRRMGAIEIHSAMFGQLSNDESQVFGLLQDEMRQLRLSLKQIVDQGQLRLSALCKSPTENDTYHSLDEVEDVVQISQVRYFSGPEL